MIIKEDKIRVLIRKRLLEFKLGAIDFKLKRTGGRSISSKDSSSLEVSTDTQINGFKQEVFIGQGKYVMPAPIFNGEDFASQTTSTPQAKRTDVGMVKNKATGEEKERGSGAHEAYDFRSGVGTPVVAFFDGEVAKINTDVTSAGGNTITLSHNDESISGTFYAHLSKIFVNRKDKVKAGQIIGLSGDTGNITGPHLHFGIVKKGESRNSSDKRFYDNLFTQARKIKITTT